MLIGGDYHTTIGLSKIGIFDDFVEREGFETLAKRIVDTEPAHGLSENELTELLSTAGATRSILSKPLPISL
jgi:hypothetical protein